MGWLSNLTSQGHIEMLFVFNLFFSLADQLGRLICPLDVGSSNWDSYNYNTLFLKMRMVKVQIHSELCSITHVATKVHVILRSFLVLTWMCDNIELV